MAESERDPASAFHELGLDEVVETAKAEIRQLYREDSVPWVIGYSGGKDSSASLQLMWLALEELPEDERTKPVHVISTDTLVENPVVASWVNRSLTSIQKHSDEAHLPFVAHRLTPPAGDSFWVNLIGRGYPAPRPKFRWCTERLKINPSNHFIRETVRENGEAVLVLGTRKSESVARGRTMARHAEGAVRDRLTVNGSLPNSLVYTPIEDWTSDDVWAFLMLIPNPWGIDNAELMGMYRGATADGECPLVVDTSTPSCGNSRFGCWVCTLVDEDKSMGAMIRNDEEKSWMQPLLDLRNEFDFRSEQNRKRDRSRRDFRRIGGHLTYYTDAGGDGQLVPGPYKQEAREYWLRRLLETQQWIRTNGPDYVRELELITNDELHEIRRMWIVDKHEVEDRLPEIYENVLGEPYPGPPIEENLVFDRETLALLRETCGEENPLHYEMLRTLLEQERRYRTMARRKGLFETLEKTITKCYFQDEADALDFESRKAAAASRETLGPEEPMTFVAMQNLPHTDESGAEEAEILSSSDAIVRQD
ncbi:MULTISPECIES: DNA phosphorothioation system sulfurtransferase DndC [unclassified Thioalkalivibrio]|uniref:DNA phosphorothioation system sulfurtransferase DndC n=1 Tax=unclassified Thioalkalivibrio TaxID=2621013 RepID=UPI001E5D53A7|nr:MULTISPECIES: DNA phosphorothioation system sulfurtransferase DndC [unclassified Thioalkalivibrio]